VKNEKTHHDTNQRNCDKTYLEHSKNEEFHKGTTVTPDFKHFSRISIK
jgi:hypothetical protein